MNGPLRLAVTVVTLATVLELGLIIWLIYPGWVIGRPCAPVRRFCRWARAGWPSRHNPASPDEEKDTS